jgi:carbon monoxide dehydrogenase subunit G
MLIEGGIDVGASRQRLWDFLLDLDRFASCLPGVESVRQVNDSTFAGILVTKLGPMSGSFNFQAAIVEKVPPRAMRVRTEGKDSITGSSVVTDLELLIEQPGNDRSRMSYRADVEISGPLAIIGDMILRATASFLMTEFGKRLRSRLEGDKGAPERE